MQIGWRQAIGPALTTALAVCTVAVPSHPLAFTAIMPLLASSAGFAAAIGGSGAGLVSAAIAAGSGALALPDTPDRLSQLSILAIAALATAAIGGRLHRIVTNDLVWQREGYATAERLSAALDRIDIGVVLLDPDTRAEFMNRAFRDTFAISDDKADSKPPFIALMYHGRDAGVYDMPEDELAHYIAERTEQMRSGDPAPLNLKLADGRTLRVSCTALPDGSRMMSYVPLDDVLRHDDDPAERVRYLGMRRTRYPGHVTSDEDK